MPIVNDRKLTSLVIIKQMNILMIKGSFYAIKYMYLKSNLLNTWCN